MKTFFSAFACLLIVCGLFFLCPVQRVPYTPKIYDCFLFYNELELLEIRLHEMYDKVDKFVLVEACETFRGKPKPFTFAENKHLFEKYNDKIIHVMLTEPFQTEDFWERERFQRQQVFRGLTECRNEDIIFLSDVDEIVRRDAIAPIASLITSGKAQAVSCQQKMYYAYLNRAQGDWPGTVATSYRNAQRMTTKYMRKLRNMKPKAMRHAGIKKMIRVPNAGWHFTSMGGTARHIQKIESYSHTKIEQHKHRMADHVAEVLASLPCEEIDATFPQFVQENQARLCALGFIDIPKKIAE